MNERLVQSKCVGDIHVVSWGDCRPAAFPPDTCRSAFGMSDDAGGFRSAIDGGKRMFRKRTSLADIQAHCRERPVAKMLAAGLTAEAIYAADRISTTPALQAAKRQESMMDRSSFPVVVAIAIVGLSPGSSAESLISKKYILDRKQSDDVARIIENAAPSPLNINWPELRRKIYKSSLPTEHFRITSVAGRIAISDDSPRPIIDVFAGGGLMKWKINDGQVLDVSAIIDGDAIKAKYTGDGYERTTIYHNVGASVGSRVCHHQPNTVGANSLQERLQLMTGATY